MAGPRVAHVIEQLRPGGPLYALIGASKLFDGQHSPRARIISLLPADGRACQLAAQAGIPVLSAPPAGALLAELADADIVQFHFWNGPVIHALLATELPPMRALVWCHVNGLHPPHILPAFLFDFADVVAATSEASLQLPVFRSANPARVDWVMAGADFSRVEGAAPVAHTGINVGYVGLLDFAKLHPSFVRMSAAVNARPIRFQVGGNGDSGLEIERQARHLGALDRFEFLGHVSDIGALFSTMDIFGYPLCTETYATSELVLQEAMHAGVPPVVFSHGGMDKLVTHARNGLVVATECGYVEAIEQLSHDPAERRRLGANAAADARCHFGAQRTAPALEAIYQRLLQKPKRQRPVAGGNWSGPGQPAGAWAFARSLDGYGDRDFLASLGECASDTMDAEDRIARAGPGVRSVVLQYRVHYPNDPYLRLWSGLLLAHAGRPALAAAEFNACLSLGLDHARVRHYFSAAASPVQPKVQP